MTKSKLKATVYARLEAIASAEKITRLELGELSRELLVYVPESDDIDIVNRLVGVLTPVNRKVAIHFFSHFLPWEVENDAAGEFSRFGKKSKGMKKLKRCADNITEFLAEKAHNIWTWAEENITTEVKQKDFSGMLSRLVGQALNGDEKSDTPAMSPDQILAAVFAGGVSIDDMLAAAASAEAEIAAYASELSASSDITAKAA